MWPLVALGLIATNAAALWKMWEFRDELHAYTENERWEQAVPDEARPIVMFGDSEIYYWPLTEFGAIPVLDRGIPGELATQEVDRFRREVLPLMPRQVVLLSGTNDIAAGISLADIAKAIGAMLSEARARNVSVVLCSVLPASGELGRVRPPAKLRALNMVLRMLAMTYGARFVDLYSEVANGDEFRAELTRDGLHPSEAGYMRLTQAVLPLLDLGN
jgi:lysophospholipase L1-like esterase